MSLPAVVVVYTRVLVTKWPGNIRAVEGGAALAECAATVDPRLVENTTMSWIKNDVSISAEKNLSGLRFNKLNSSDEGVYSCQIENFLEKKIIQFRVIVESKLKVVLTSQHHDYFEQENIILQCTAGSTQKHVITWYKDDKLIENESKDSLIIKNAKLEDEGSYRCVVSSDIDKAESSVRVRVLEEPEILGDSLSSVAATGAALNMTCTAAVDPRMMEAVEWSWNRDNTLIAHQPILKKVSRGNGQEISNFYNDGT